MKKEKKNPLSGFLIFIREQGIIGLSIGFILGGAVSGLAKSLVNDILSPLLAILLGKVSDFSEAVWVVGEAEIRWGSFVMTLLDFILIAIVVYFFIKGLGLDKIDKKKDGKKKK